MSLAVVRDTALPLRPRRRQDVRQAVEKLRRRYPRDGDRLAKALVDTLLDDRDLLLDVARFVIEKIAAVTETRQRMSRAAPSPRERAARKVSEQAAVKEIAAKVKMLVLDTIMPNGEKLRFCRGSEVAQWGAGFSLIAERVGPDCLVGEVLCERDVAELLRVPPT
jgi:hypothetical protein